MKGSQANMYKSGAGKMEGKTAPKGFAHTVAAGIFTQRFFLRAASVMEFLAFCGGVGFTGRDCLRVFGYIFCHPILAECLAGFLKE